MPKCPLKNFEECDKDCAWYFDGVNNKACAIKLIANTESLMYLDAIQKKLSGITDKMDELKISK